MEVIILKPFLSQSIAIMDRAFGVGYALPSRDQLFKQNKLVRNLVDAGVWTGMRELFIFANDAPNLNYGYINWVNPATTLGFGSGPLSKISNIGVKGNGISAYMAVTNTTTLAEDSFFMAREYDNIQAGSIDASVLFGGRSGSGSNLIRCAPRSNSNTFRWTIKENEANSAASSDSTGFSTLVGSLSYAKAYKNGVLLQSTDDVVGTLHFQIYLLADLNNALPQDYSLRTIQLFLTGSNSLEASITTLESIFNDYLSTI